MAPEKATTPRERRIFFLGIANFDSELDSTSKFDDAIAFTMGHGAQEPAEWKMLIGITSYVSTLCAVCWLSQTGSFLMMISSSKCSIIVSSSKSYCHTVFESTDNSSSWRRLGIVKHFQQPKQWLLMGNLDKAIFTSPVSTTTYSQPIHVGSLFSPFSTVP
jgi:hypothetical protein